MWLIRPVLGFPGSTHRTRFPLQHTLLRTHSAWAPQAPEFEPFPLRYSTLELTSLDLTTMLVVWLVFFEGKMWYQAYTRRSP